MAGLGRPGVIDLREDAFSLHLTNISTKTNLADLYFVFNKFGNVANIYVPGRNKKRHAEHEEILCEEGDAFVRYFRREEADKAVTKLHGQDIEGMTLKLRFEKNRRLREWEYYEKDKIIREMEKKGLDTRAITGESREDHSERLREDREAKGDRRGTSQRGGRGRDGGRYGGRGGGRDGGRDGGGRRRSRSRSRDRGRR